MRKFLVTTLVALLASPVSSAHESGIDEHSYNLGIMGGFAEVVRLGVKTLALSEVMDPAVMDHLMADAEVIADRNQVLIWRETDFLVTDLYPADVADGKHVLLIYTGDTLDQYLQIKADKEALQDVGEYSGEAREAIARRFGRLLSYPEPVIDDLLARDKLLEDWAPRPAIMAGLLDRFLQPLSRIVVPGEHANLPACIGPDRDDHVVALRDRCAHAFILPDQPRPAPHDPHVIGNEHLLGVPRPLGHDRRRIVGVEPELSNGIVSLDRGIAMVWYQRRVIGK